MNMQMHTPGPWRRELVSRGQWEVFGAAGPMVCRVAKYTDGNAASADARLIAAAPELLDALRAFCGDYESTPLQIPELQAAYTHALTIIAKAEGRG